MKNVVPRILPWALLALLMVAAPALAEEPAAEEAVSTAVQFAGMQLHLDPETGEMRAPSAEEARQLAKVMHQRFGRHLTTHAPSPDKNGDLQVVLGLEHFNFTVVSLDADGAPVTHCHDDLASAAEALASESLLPIITQQEDR